jgi:acyl carrier protein
LVKNSKEFEEIVSDLETKYSVSVDPAVIKEIVKVVERDLKALAARKSLSVKGVGAYFKRVSPKIWYRREPLVSVEGLIVRLSKKLGIEIPAPAVREELNKVYTSLTADTLYAAAAYVVLTRGRKPNPGDATITLQDAEQVCKDFLLMPKPTWLC